jgi:hypothetical protein
MIQAGLAVKAGVTMADLRKEKNKRNPPDSKHKMLSLRRSMGLNP